MLALMFNLPHIVAARGVDSALALGAGSESTVGSIGFTGDGRVGMLFASGCMLIICWPIGITLVLSMGLR